MDISSYYGMMIVIAMAIYMAVGYYYKGLKQGEAFNVQKCLETVVLVVLLTATGLMSGIVVTAEWISNLLGTLGQNPATITAIITAFIALIDQFVKNGGRIVTAATTGVIKTEQAKASLPEATIPAKPGFVLPRDGRTIMEGKDGFWLRQCANPDRANVPDDQNYQWVSPTGKTGVGDKEAMIYLITSLDAEGWRKRNI